jgi:2-dehydropantoate 2-reductase
MKTKILIAGIGGVGGFIGAKLAQYEEQNDGLEIYFLSRGKNLEKILSHGIELIETEGSILARPSIAADNCSSYPKMDVVVLSCKSYDLENICDNISNSVDAETIVIPLLNGISHSEILRRKFPDSILCSAFIYIVSKLEAPAQILMESKSHSLYFEHISSESERLIALENLFEAAGIHAFCVDNIEENIWRKFTFISPIATYTSAYNLTKKNIVEHAKHANNLKEMMVEVFALSQSLKIKLPDNILEQHWEQFLKLPDGSSSSMHRDYIFGKPTEIATLSEYVVTQSQALGLNTPYYNKAIEQIGKTNYN